MGLIRSIRTEQRIGYSFTVSELDWNLESVVFYVTFKDFQSKMCYMNLPLFGCNAAF